MAIPTIQASYDFVFARLHGLWAVSVKGEALENLAKSTTEELLQRNLRNLGIECSSRTEFQKIIYTREVGELNRMARLLSDAEAKLYLAVEAQAYFENLKIALHKRYSLDGRTEEDWKFSEAPGLPVFDAKALATARDTRAFIQGLPLFGSLKRNKLESIVLALEERRDFMLAECVLDQYYYNDVYTAAMGIAGKVGEEARRLLGIHIDIMNLCMLVRNAQTYHFEPAQMKKLWLENGLLLNKIKLNTLVLQSKITDLLASMPGKYRRVLESTGGQEVYQWENALWKYLYAEAHRSFYAFDVPALAIAAFPVLLQVECQNLGRIYEGIHFGIPSQSILDMMIE